MSENGQWSLTLLTIELIVGGSYNLDGSKFPASTRSVYDDPYFRSTGVGFRVALFCRTES